jgi:hypothetical protein
VETRNKNFHFQEMDWVISFPQTGNRGRKYLYYNVLFSNRKTGKIQDQVCLVDILEKPEFENSFPHTVGFFKENNINSSSGIDYMEIRIVRSIEEFWKFLNDLDL